MKRLLCTLAMMAMAWGASAQVSYLEMVATRDAAAPDYISPASLTPAAGTDQYMELDGNRVKLYDYKKVSEGKVVFQTDHLIMSYVESPDGTMAL